MGRVFLFKVALFQALGLFALLFAANAVAREAHDRPSAIRMQMRNEEAVITKNGTLSCKAAEENTGAACQLLFQVENSGRTLKIIGQKTPAMRLYLDGKREVRIEGLVKGPYIQLKKIHAL